jgi:ribosome-binding protein aMBF1 (putative translation factor)
MVDLRTISCEWNGAEIMKKSIPTPKSVSASKKLSKKFGVMIQKLRSERGWSMRDLSSVAKGLNPSYISRVEAGKIEPCLNGLNLLASAFGLTLAELLSGLD